MGSKYTTRYNDVPPPGYYSPDPGHSLISSKSSTAFIRLPNDYKVPKDVTPDAGMYHPDKGR